MMARIPVLMILAAIYWTCGEAGDRSAPQTEKPNILVIQPDQLRADMMGCAGQPDVLTPNLDRLAAEGIRFTRTVSGGPVCCPFRASFQTGLYIHEHGVARNNVLLDTNLTTFAEILVEDGYRTGYIGKWHLDGGVPPEVGGYVEEGERRQGWQDWNGYEKAHEFFEVWEFDEHKQKRRVEGYHWEPTWQTDKAIAFMQENEANGDPWCYYVAYGPPHNPFQCPQEYLDLYDPKALTLSPPLLSTLTDDEEQKVRRLRQIYYGQVTAVDVEIGRLMDALDAMEIAENTIVFFVSDHGDVLGAHAAEVKERYLQEKKVLTYYLRTKGKPYTTALRVPFIIRWPGQIEPGQVNDVLINSVDLAPTLLDLAGQPVPAHMSGRSMAGWCISDDGPEKQALYLGLWENQQAWRGVWDGRYLYSNLDYQVFYDHQNDPHEIDNLFNQPEHRQAQRSMEEKLLELAEATGDPILPRLEAAIGGAR